MTPEREIVLLSARPHLSQRAAARVAELVRQNLDWRQIAHTAMWHSIGSIAYRNLCEIPEALEDTRRSQLALADAACRLDAARQVRDLLRITDLFCAEGIDSMSFKGPTLAAIAYGNVALRQYCDLDILVRPGDVAAATQILTGIGFGPPHPHPMPASRVFRVSSDEFYGDGLTPVDLHRSIMERFMPFALEFEQLSPARRPVKLGNGEVWTLGAVDLLLYVCCHGTKHGWQRLGWVSDTAALVEVERIEFAPLLEKARAHNILRPLLLGLMLAHHLLAASVPQDVIALAQRDHVVSGLAEHIQSRIFTFKELSMFGDWLFPVLALDKTRDRARYIAETLLSPSPKDWDWIRLPVSLLPLYYGTRPLRLCYQYGGQFVAKAASSLGPFTVESSR